MKYANKQTARKGDKCQAGPSYGSCRILHISKSEARIKNTQTDEIWEVDSLEDFDLIARKNAQ
jgi:hypothetical protein